MKIKLIRIMVALFLLPPFILPVSAQSATLSMTNNTVLGPSVFWPITNSGYSLEWTPTLPALLPWQSYPATPSVSEDGNSLVVNVSALEASNPAAFFVLVSNYVAIPAAPAVVTTAPSPINYTGAELQGTVQPNLLDTTWWFQWGLDTSYGNTTASGLVVGSNTSAVAVYTGITGLSPGTTYHFQLYGSNADGISSGGDLTFSTPAAQPDATVQTFAASNITGTSAQLNGSVNPNGTELVGWFQWGGTTNYGNDTPNFYDSFQNFQVVDESYTLNGLTPNTTYHYQIVAFNGGPTEAFGNNVIFTTSTSVPQYQPPIVATASATSVTGTTATLNATINPNGSATTAAFLYGTTTGYGQSPGTFPAGSGSTAQSFQANLTGLTPNTTYNYTIDAGNSGGSSQGTNVIFTTSVGTQPLPTIQTLKADGITTSAADLNGSVNPNGASTTTLYFQWGTTTSYGNIIGMYNYNSTTPQTEVQAGLTNLMAATTYHYQFVGSNSGGISYGADVVFTTAIPSGMAVIPGGPFLMGNSIGDSDITDATPTEVTVSTFFMDSNLVSYSQWQLVYNSATASGYGFDNAGSAKGNAANQPVQNVNWYDAVKWGNARSQLAGLIPVYYTDAGFTQIYTNGDTDAIYPNWTANGYRLPTEAEWEGAARGGLSSLRFPWGNTISESQANYVGCTTNCGYSYDLGPAGDNAIGSIGGTDPATSPVGSFAANGYGLYDMAGNALEWCWDWYGTPYGQPTATDPTGPPSGTNRVYRGGAWDGGADFARCAERLHYIASDFIANDIGFRCVRGH